MLLAREFTVGSLAEAKPLSLILPRNEHELTFLIGEFQMNIVAVTLDGNHVFHSFECSKITHWQGLLIPNVHIEVDESSVFDPNSLYAQLGSLERTDTQLSINAIPDNSFGRRVKVILETGLAPTGQDQKAGFSRWSIVLGEDTNKRVLRQIDSAQTTQH